MTGPIRSELQDLVARPGLVAGQHDVFNQLRIERSGISLQPVEQICPLEAATLAGVDGAGDANQAAGEGRLVQLLEPPVGGSQDRDEPLAVGKPADDAIPLPRSVRYQGVLFDVQGLALQVTGQDRGRHAGQPDPRDGGRQLGLPCPGPQMHPPVGDHEPMDTERAIVGHRIGGGQQVDHFVIGSKGVGPDRRRVRGRSEIQQQAAGVDPLVMWGISYRNHAPGIGPFPQNMSQTTHFPGRSALSGTDPDNALPAAECHSLSVTWASMARSPRTDPNWAWHHVMNRGARRQPTFLDDTDRRSFLELLGDIHQRHGVNTHAYCLMGNHHHLLLSCPAGSLSAGMHHLASVYTQRFNRRHGLDGPLYRGRFHSVPIHDDGYLMEVSRYIHRNPLDLDQSIDLARFRWSSYGAYVGRRTPAWWLRRSMILEMFDGLPERYAAYVESARPGVRDHRVDRAAGTTTLNPTSRPPSIDDVETVVAVITGVPRSELATRGKGDRSVARNLVLLLGLDDARVPANDLADRFGYARATSVRSAVHRGRAKLNADPTFTALVDRARMMLAEPSAFGVCPR